MVSRVFLDANVLLDLVLKRSSYGAVERLFEEIVSGEVRAFISPSIVHIVAYWTSKTYGKSHTREILIDLLRDVHVLGMDHEITKAALDSGIGDIEDSLQYVTALHHGIEVFISNDKRLKRSVEPACRFRIRKSFCSADIDHSNVFNISFAAALPVDLPSLGLLSPRVYC